MKNSLIAFVFCFALYACKEKEELKPVSPANSPVIVLNEGNFNSSNASISLFDATNNSIQQKVFQNSNQGRPLGDVAQSMIELQGVGYVVVNNSGKIEVLDLNTFQSLGQITGLNSPRYILPIAGSKAYVSDLYQDEIYVVDLRSLAIVSRIPVKGWVEEMALVQDKAFVCHMDSNQVWVIDTQKDSVIKKINTAISPSSIQVDAFGALWVACTGGINNGNPALQKINASSMVVERSLVLADPSRSISNIKFAPGKQLGYYLAGDLYEFSVYDTLLPSAPLIRANGRIFYGFGVHPSTGELYLTDAVDYVQSGVLIRHTPAGQELHVSRLGLIPGYIHFR